MKQFLLFCVVFSSLYGISWAQEKKKTIAVLEFQRTGALEASEATTLTNRFRGLLVQTKSFTVVEREKMAQILQEQDFVMSDQCNSAECAVQVGQLLGVEAMIAGDIGKVGQTYTLDLRMVDVSTGQILKTFNEDYKGEIDGLLSIMKKAAEQFAGVEIQGTGGKITQTSQTTKSASKMKWIYISAGVAAAGGTAVLLLTGKKNGSSVPPIYPPSWPSDINKK